MRTDARAAQPLPVAEPTAHGFSAEGIARIDEVLGARGGRRRRIPGPSSRSRATAGSSTTKAYGYLDREAGTPMPLDAIFQLASMTKVMAGVGALTLTEQGRLPLRSRLDAYFPQFANPKVGVVLPNGRLATEPARQPITIHDLLRHLGHDLRRAAAPRCTSCGPAAPPARGAAVRRREFIAKVAGCRCSTRRERCGTTACRPTCSAGRREGFQGKRLGAFLKDACGTG